MTKQKVLLVYPYFYTGRNKDQLFPPIGVGILSARLKKKGINVEKLDCTFLTQEEAIQAAEKYKPDITGIYIMTTLAKNSEVLLEKLRIVNPDSLYTAGGPLPTLYPEKFAMVFDYVFQGEAAKSYPSFCHDYLNAQNRFQFMDHLKPEKYPGIYSLKPYLISSPANHLTKEEIDGCPIMDRDGFDHKMYQELSHRNTGKRTTSIMTTFGCPYSCDFCSKPIFGNQVRFRSIESIFEEIRNIISYGYDSLWIADDLFTYDLQFLKSFCDRMMEEGLQVSWSCLSRVDCITDESAKMMKKAGCNRVYLGIESGNNEVLKLMNKKIDLAEVRKGVELFKGNGIGCAGFFIVGYPGETEETIEDTFAFALSLGMDEISFNVPYPLPGSALYERLSEISEEDWAVENETKFLYKCEFDEDWLKRRIKETYDKFGFNIENKKDMVKFWR